MAAALLRKLLCNLGAVTLPRKSAFRLVAAMLCSFRVVASTLLRERSFRSFRHDAGECSVRLGGYASECLVHIGASTLLRERLFRSFRLDAATLLCKPFRLRVESLKGAHGAFRVGN